MANITTPDATVILYAVVFPGIIVSVISIFAFFNRQVGIPLLLATAALGGLAYVVCDSDNRSKQSLSQKYHQNANGGSIGHQSHFERDPVDMNRGPLTGRALLLGVGLCSFSMTVFLLFYFVG